MTREEAGRLLTQAALASKALAVCAAKLETHSPNQISWFLNGVRHALAEAAKSHGVESLPAAQLEFQWLIEEKKLGPVEIGLAIEDLRVAICSGTLKGFPL